MIDFTQDGPFSEKADQLFPGRVRILGLGQTGVSVCDQIVLHGRPQQDLWVFDTDQLSIEGSVVPNRHLLGRELVRGMGCGGDIDLAREIVVQEDGRLVPVSRGCDFLILVVGLGGGTGVALAERFIELGHEAETKVIVVGVQPFAFEGPTRRERAIAAIGRLRAEADSVLVLSHDRLSDDPATVKNIRHGFHLMHKLLAETAQALGQVVCKRGLIQLSFADVRSLFGRYSGSEVLENCWAAHVDGDIHDQTEDLVAQLLACPLLGDEAIWKQIDHAIVAVSGTRNLGLSDVQELVAAFKDRLPHSIPIATSASLDDESHDKVRMTVLFATTAPARLSVPEIVAAVENPRTARRARPVPKTVPLAGVPKATVEPPITVPLPRKPRIKPPAAPVPAPMTVETHTIPEEEPYSPNAVDIEPPILAPVRGTSQAARRFEARQEEMQFEGPNRGRFEKTLETMYRGENLDQPTFRRRGLVIRV